MKNHGSALNPRASQRDYRDRGAVEVFSRFSCCVAERIHTRIGKGSADSEQGAQPWNTFVSWCFVLLVTALGIRCGLEVIVLVVLAKLFIFLLSVRFILQKPSGSRRSFIHSSSIPC